LAKPSPDSSSPPRLLAIELWGLGDLVLALPFLRTASAHARVTLLAKPAAVPLLERFAPQVSLVPLVAPWTAFSNKYRLHGWPWRELARVRTRLHAENFDFGVSARPDPRDHFLLATAGARRRFGFLRSHRAAALASRSLLTDRVAIPASLHRSAYWQALALALGWPPPPTFDPSTAQRRLRLTHGARVVLHSGAGRPTKVWPLDRVAVIAEKLRAAGYTVQLLCDAGQLAWWRTREPACIAPATVAELLVALDGAAAFVGNDSGPGHVAALLDIPTFTLFGNQFPAAFAPIHPAATWIEGSPCAFKPCYDSCRFPIPYCLHDVSEEVVWSRLSTWLGD
jgi:heptosyltransferase-2